MRNIIWVKFFGMKWWCYEKMLYNDVVILTMLVKADTSDHSANRALYLNTFLVWNLRYTYPTILFVQAMFMSLQKWRQKDKNRAKRQNIAWHPDSTPRTSACKADTSDHPANRDCIWIHFWYGIYGIDTSLRNVIKCCKWCLHHLIFSGPKFIVILLKPCFPIKKRTFGQHYE